MRRELALVLVAVGLVAGVGLGWRLFTPEPAPIETPAPEVRQGDGSVVLERAPDPAAKPAHEVPRGGTVERQVSVVVRPDPVTRPRVDSQADSLTEPEAAHPPVHNAPPGAQADTILCPDVTVDLSLVRMPDRTRRVIASARGGTILGGLDIPVESPVEAKRLLWAAGAIWAPGSNAFGGFIHRDVGPLRVGLDVIQSSRPSIGRNALEARLLVGIRW